MQKRKKVIFGIQIWLSELYGCRKIEVLDMTVEDIRHTILNLVDRYAIKHVILFGSRAAGTNNEYSDVDLIIEF